MKIGIVDYGMGNIRSISCALQHIGVEEVVVSAKYEILRSVDKLLLPGVGSFGRAINQIRALEIDKFLKEFVLEKKKPILGICLGMQLMAHSSNEDGENLGLGFIDAKVSKFIDGELKVPHVGFNQVKIPESSSLYAGMTGDMDFYFTHSYRVMSEIEINAAFCSYGERFIASFEKENIAGVQFHPELSQNNGLKLLNNFIENF